MRSCLVAARFSRWISLVSLSFFAAAPATARMSAWKSSSQERITPAIISKRPCSWSTSSSARRRPAWKASTAGESAPALLTASAAERLHETASCRASKALGASSSASSKRRPTFPSASCTRSFGGRRATTASMGTQRLPVIAAGPVELHSTFEGLPRQPRDGRGRRSALPRRRSRTSSRPSAWTDASRWRGSQASRSSCREQPGMNWRRSRASWCCSASHRG
mmetsp:Transcript_74322/g.229656  ORF Transcript_74322/g.229656 Transcript_74322/m.229656 type:complete len:222 (-) Transcript_74322:845-1510(-)